MEDGDLHTYIKRQKQFKWSGLDDDIEVGPRRDEGEASLDKIAQFNKVKDDRVVTGAKGRNFVFAAISP